MPNGWSGELWIGTRMAVHEGTTGDANNHAHYAHQVLRGINGMVSVAVESDVVYAACVLIPSMAKHRIHANNAPIFSVFTEPLAIMETALYESVMMANLDIDSVFNSVAKAIESAAASEGTALGVDARVYSALCEIDAQIGEKVSAGAVAKRAAISLSQLERLFRQQVGISVRRLVLWRRVILAINILSQGGSLTQAAYLAGFTDSAHFSRTIKTMFGVNANASLKNLKITVKL